MLYEDLEDPESVTAAELRRRYERAVADAARTVGLDRAAEAAGVDRATLESLADGESPDLTVEQAAAVLGLAEDNPDADAIVAEVRDGLMLGMSTAVLDVDALATDLDNDLEPRTLQQKIEGRQPMTLREYARIRHVVAIRGA